MSNTLGSLPHPVEVSRYTKGEELRITHAYTTAQMEAERLRCFDLGVSKATELWQSVVFDGYSVLKRLDEAAAKRTTHQNVSDTLDALMRVFRSTGLS